MFKYKYQYMDFLVVLYYIHVSSTSVIVFPWFPNFQEKILSIMFYKKKKR